ncbi:MAG: hypothetical protein IJH84_09535, partial [Saccharopolyspora sp.]|uniref:hypothetical protein n=1 Tax=Saccharopolyspora sp. TaxID=33915 RepID=UPI0025EF26C1
FLDDTGQSLDTALHDALENRSFERALQNLGMSNVFSAQPEEPGNGGGLITGTQQAPPGEVHRADPEQLGSQEGDRVQLPGDAREHARLTSRLADLTGALSRHLAVLPGQFFPGLREQVVTWQEAAERGTFSRTPTNRLRTMVDGAHGLHEQVAAQRSQQIAHIYRQAANTRAQLGEVSPQFYRDGVPGGVSSRPDVQFGFEVEFQVDSADFDQKVNELGNKLAERDLANWEDEQGLLESGDAEVEEAHREGKWAMLTETSDLDAAELVSPVLTPGAEPRAWENFGDVMDLVWDADGYAENMGGHVNVSSTEMLTPPEYLRLARLGKVFESVLYRLGNYPNHANQRPIKLVGPNPLPPDPSAVSSFEDVRKLSRGKFDALNFQHVGPDSAAHRVEFRFWAGSVDKGVWQAHAELSAAMLAAAKDPSIDAQLEQLLAAPLLLGHSPAGLPQLAQLLGLLPMSPESQQQAVELFAATDPWKGDGNSDFYLRSQTVGLPGDRGLYFPAAGRPVATAVQVAQTAQSHPGADLVLADLAAGTERISLWNGRTLDGNLFAGNLRYRGIGHGKPVVLAMSGAARTDWFPGFTDTFDTVLTAPQVAFTADGRFVAVRHTVGPDGRLRVEQDPQGWVQHSAEGSVATGEPDLNPALASLDPRGDEKEQLASRIDDSLQRAQQYLNALPGDALPQQRGQIMQWATARNAILER